MVLQSIKISLNVQYGYNDKIKNLYFTCNEFRAFNFVCKVSMSTSSTVDSKVIISAGIYGKNHFDF